MMKTLLVLTAFVCFFATAPAPSARAATPPGANIKKPNIVLIYADDIGYGDFGCYGAKGVKTPNVDRIAKEGLRFTSAYAASATCTPSRFSLLTGSYPFRQEGTGIARGDAAMIIKPGTVTLPSILRDAGYTTSVIGKWHLGLGTTTGELDWNGEIKPSPVEIGFDYSFIMAATGDRVPCVYVENHHVVGLVSGDPIQVSYGKPFPGEPTGISDRAKLKMDWSHGHNQAIVDGIGRIGYMKGGRTALWKDEDMADVFTRKALAFIEDNKARPFFLYFATHDVHVPRVPHPRFAGASTMGPRGDAIAEFDASVGEILQKLDELDLDDNTLVIVTSDNGPVLDDGYKDDANEKIGEHRPAGPFRAGKYSQFEGGTRMPFIVRWPNRVKPGTSDAIISQVDFPATLGALAGEDAAKHKLPDSLNLLPALLGDTATGRDHVVEDAFGQAIRTSKWKYIPPGKTRDGLGPWETVAVPEPGLLFDLAADPAEATDLAAKHPKKVKELRAQLEKIVSGGRTPRS